MGNFAIFACGCVGIEAIKLFIDHIENLKLVILDSQDFKGMNKEIISLTNKYKNVNVCYYDDIDIIKFTNYNIDLAILAWWPYIIKSPLLEIPRLGFLNTHPSLLPYGKGKHPNFWAIVDNEPFGVSLHLIEKTIDSGPVLFQEKIQCTWEDTGESLYNKAVNLICELLRKNKEKIINLSFTSSYQDYKKGSFHLAKEIDHRCIIELDKEYKARDLINILRGRTFEPYPAAYFIDNGESFEVRIKINKVER
jgi:methionyl-tRNA formyltransferase